MDVQFIGQCYDIKSTIVLTKATKERRLIFVWFANLRDKKFDKENPNPINLCFIYNDLFEFTRKQRLKGRKKEFLKFQLLYNTFDNCDGEIKIIIKKKHSKRQKETHETK